MRRLLSVLLVSALLLSVLLHPGAVYAVKKGNSNSWEGATDVSLDKDWTITFSEELNRKLLLNNFIYVVDSAGTKMDTSVYYDEITKKIRVQAPSGGYAPETKYTLVIEEGLQSNSKKKLGGAVLKPFTTGRTFSEQDDFIQRSESAEEFVLQESLEILEEQQVFTENYDLQVIRVDSSASYAADDIIILPPTEKYPFGFAAKVVSVTPVVNGFELKIIEPEMDEVIKEFDVSKEVGVEATDVTVPDELIESNFSSTFVDQLGLLDPTVTVSERENGFSIVLSDVGYEISGEEEPIDGVTVSGDAGIKLSGTIHFDNALTTMDIKKEGFLNLPVVHNIGFTAEQKLKLDAQLYGNAKVDMKFPLADIPVPYLAVKGTKYVQAGVFVRLYLVMEYDAAGNAHFSVSQEYQSRTGLNLEDNGIYKPYNSFEKMDPLFKVEDLHGHLGMKKGLQFDVAAAILQWDLASLQNKGTFNVGVDAGTLFDTDKTQFCYDFGASLNYNMSAQLLTKDFDIMNRDYSLVRFSNCELSDLNFADEKLEVEPGHRQKLEIFGKLPDGSKVDFLLPNDYISFSSTNPDIKVDVRGNIVVADDIRSGANAQIIMKYKTTNTEIEKSLSLVVTDLEEEDKEGIERIDMEERLVREISPDTDRVFKFVPSQEDLQTKTHALIGFESNVSLNVSLYTSSEAFELDEPYQVSTNAVKVPLAFEGPYYVKVTSKTKGEFEASPGYEEAPPEDHPNGGACAVEATTTDANLISSLQFVRDEFLAETERGQDVINLYNKLSPTMVWSIMKSSSLRKSLLTDLKNIDHLIHEMYRVAEGKTTTHVITKEEAMAIENILETVKNYLPQQQVEKLEEMQVEMNVSTMSGQKLDVFLEKSQLKNVSSDLTSTQELIIKLKDKEDSKNAEMQIQSLILDSSLSIDSSDIQLEPLYKNVSKELETTYVVNVADRNSLKNVMNELKKNKAVEYVQLNQPYSIQSSDVNYPYQWPLANSNQVIGGDLKYDSIVQETKNRTMKDVVVAVIDTGVNYKLADFKNIVLADRGYDFVNNDKDAMDDNDHGTHVAGIIGARADNGYSMAGLNQHTKIIPIKVLNKDGRGNSIDIARGIGHAVDNGAQVINLSLGTSSVDKTIEDAIIYAVSKNVTVVAAAGNDGNGKLSYPASSVNTISVGATTSEGTLASFSNYGQGIDIVAPGERIPSLVTSGEVMYASGTSMATPYAAAQIALFYSVSNDMNPKRVVQMISTHHVDLGDQGYDLKYGWGQVDTVSAIQSLR